MTVRIPISTNGWTKINIGAIGTISNFGDRDILLQETTDKPETTITVGHKLRPGDLVRFSLTGTDAIWGRSVLRDSNVFLSTGIEPIMDSVLRDKWLASFETSPSETTELKVIVKNLPKTAFGDLISESYTPVTQISAEYGLLGQTLTVTDSASSGSNSIVDNKFTSQTGTAADGLGSILSLRQLKYRPGQGAIARFTAVFSVGVANSQQAAGLVTAENSFVFGFLGENFGIFHAHNGESEAQELTVTTPAAGSETATVTVDGFAFSVPLTVGTVQHNALEISASLNAQVSNYSFTANNDQVVAQALLPVVAGSFAFSSATAVAAWVQITVGTPAIVEPFFQSSWNIDTMLTGDTADVLDPLKGNVYAIQYQYLGFGAIKFFVEDNKTGDFILVHIIRFANLNTVPSVSNPAFRVGWFAQNLGNTTNLTIQGSSAGAFVEGKIKRNTPPRSDSNNQLSVGLTLTNIIAFRNRIHFGGKVNRAEVFPLLATASTDANKAAIFEIVANPTFGGDVNFTYVDKDNSIMEIATDSVSVSGGVAIGTLTVAAGSSEVIQFNERADLDFTALPGQFFSIAARVSSGAAADMQASGTWQEDL